MDTPRCSTQYSDRKLLKTIFKRKAGLKAKKKDVIGLFKELFTFPLCLSSNQLYESSIMEHNFKKPFEIKTDVKCCAF